MSQKIELTHDEPQYRDRLTNIAICAVHRGSTAYQVREEIEACRNREGDAAAEDLRKLCRDRWRRLGL